MGHSVARDERDALVIETTGIAPDRTSFRMRLTERYTRSADGTRLFLTATLADPVMLREPVVAQEGLELGSGGNNCSVHRTASRRLSSPRDSSDDAATRVDDRGGSSSLIRRRERSPCLCSGVRRTADGHRPGRRHRVQVHQPHSLMSIDVTDETGKVVKWSVEFDGVLNLTEGGWTERSIVAGQRLRVSGNPTHANSARMSFRRLVRADGTEVMRHQDTRGTTIDEQRRERARQRSQQK